MEDRANTAEPSAKTLAAISALADGTLDPEREPAVRELIAGSPELSERYELERRAVAALHQMRADRAPDHLRARLEAQRRAAGLRRRAASRPARARLIYGGAAAAMLAVVLLAVILLLPSGTPGSPSVSQAAALALRGPAGPAPGSNGHKLRKDVDEVYFPDLSRSLGYRAVGQRTDRLDGHEAVTVYYAKGGRMIAYTIVAASLRIPAASGVWTASTYMHTYMVGTRLVIAWRRAGDTCVVSSNGPSIAELEAFAG